MAKATLVLSSDEKQHHGPYEQATNAFNHLFSNAGPGHKIMLTLEGVGSFTLMPDGPVKLTISPDGVSATISAAATPV